MNSDSMVALMMKKPSKWRKVKATKTHTASNRYRYTYRFWTKKNLGERVDIRVPNRKPTEAKQ